MQLWFSTFSFEPKFFSRNLFTLTLLTTLLKGYCLGNFGHEACKCPISRQLKQGPGIPSGLLGSGAPDGPGTGANGLVDRSVLKSLLLWLVSVCVASLWHYLPLLRRLSCGYLLGLFQLFFIGGQLVLLVLVYRAPSEFGPVRNFYSLLSGSYYYHTFSELHLSFLK